MESKKLKANELRIGNLVHYNKEHKEVGTITSIMAHINGKDTVGLNSRVNLTFDTDEIEPIPLTEEKLIEFEFEKVIGWDDMIFWREKEWIHKSQWFELMELNQGFCFDDYINIESVHQLQNLFFSLRNEELPLTNKATNPL